MALIPQTTRALETKIDTVLAQDGFVEPKERDPIISVLDRNNAGLEETVGVLSNIMHMGENEAARLSAVRTALELHGQIGKNNANGNNTMVNIVIENSGPDQPRRIDAVLCPQRG